jgi:phospholipid-binding lipoprotein MlaA
MKSALKNALKAAGLLLLSSVLLIGCGLPTLDDKDWITPKRPVSEYVKDDVHYMAKVYDPWEYTNRQIYKFNAKFDEYIFLPVVSAYEWVLPDFVEDGISNFFNNMGEATNFINSVLQLRMDKAGITLGRFVINTTIGVLGVWDPAFHMGIYRQQEDFGQTLAVYGVGNGPYLVLPIFGPSTLRDTTGFVFDTATIMVLHKQVMDELNWSDGEKDLLNYSLVLLQGIDTRHITSFRYFETGSPFEYELVRMLYIEARKFLIEN